MSSARRYVAAGLAAGFCAAVVANLPNSTTAMGVVVGAYLTFGVAQQLCQRLPQPLHLSLLLHCRRALLPAQVQLRLQLLNQ